MNSQAVETAVTRIRLALCAADFGRTIGDAIIVQRAFDAIAWETDQVLRSLR